ncbi:Molecular chaperone Hsp31 and glyoxalase 3 [Aquisphaera giovannonii]|uniref:Molecular chaperone Hsp31 and glyoxalase 3 n=1 Tax=Aquisphaera giovannonii TaxID=406548 RepID=A0A5B9WC25_9BACT|nr:type 1 glutamine amidotransferase domain-containing protein [Aquisphaera giovannonii]QEH38033.1 Molecular chaperone Hsp31 and glyoxalase 3 [Aquisphaera giovannonii]
MARSNRLLIIVTNVGEYEKVGYRTGLWLGELTHFWDVAEEAGFQMDIASPAGGYVPIDPESLMLQEAGHAVGLGGEVHEHYEDRAFMDRLTDTRPVADVHAADYDAIYLTGGHGVCFDFPRSEPLAKLTADFWEAGKVVSAVCHGPAGLLEVKRGGEHLIAGKALTGFSWTEEGLAKRDKAVPYSLEDELKKRGARYSKSTIPFKGYVVEDGLLITGQNPASAARVGEAVVRRLKEAD